MQGRSRGATRAGKDAVTLQTYWQPEGPFFERDVRKTVRANIGDMLERAAAAMEAQVRGEIASHAGGMPGYSGWSWAHTKGYTTSPYTGRHWGLWAAVNAVSAGMSTPDAIRTKAAAATIERRWHPYRNVARSGRQAMKTLDLTKGLD